VKKLLRVSALVFLVASIGCSDSPTHFGRAPGDPFGVAITQNFMFAPSELDIPPGSRVVWTNQDSTAHTVTSGTPDHLTSLFSQRLEPGRSLSFTFADAGTFEFFCSIHQTMRGVIVVK
jgi:plastocyanin